MSSRDDETSGLDDSFGNADIERHAGAGIGRPATSTRVRGSGPNPAARNTAAISRPRRKKVLLVSDDPQLGRFLAALLLGDSYVLSETHVAAIQDDSLVRSTSDLVVIDAAGPDLHAVLDALHGIETPRLRGVILLADRSDEAAQSERLEGTVDVIIGKPLEPRQLLACIRGLLREPAGASPEARISAGDATIWPLRGKFRFGPRETRVTWTEGMILRELVANADAPVTREQLVRWTSGSGDDRQESSLSRHIYRLREKIGCDATGESPIRTIRGVGYVLVSKWTPVN